MPGLRRLTALMLAASLAAAPAGAQPAMPRQHAQAIEAYGGIYEGPVARYVAEVGERVATAAGRPRQCAFRVVNSDVVNAFTAPPGCHIYVTRGLLALVNSEAELAAVLGHELAHVARNHAGRRQQRSVLSTLGAAILGAVTGSSELAQIAGQAAQLNVLSFSRNQEFEADTLGLRYLQQNGYSPYALADMLAALQADDQMEARLRGREDQAVPAWARTHPLTGERIARALQQARQTGAAPGSLPEREEPFLAAIDGLLFGDDPEQGFVDGRRFAHPGLEIAFEAPPGFSLTNSPRTVKIEGPGGLAGEFSAGRTDGDLETYAFQVLRRVAGQTPVQAGRAERTRIGGFEAVILPALARTQRGSVEVTVAAYASGPGGAYHFVTLAPAGRGQAFDDLFGSVRRLSPREAAALRPRRVEVVTVRPGETVQSLAGRMAYDDLQVERFRLLNALRPGEEVRPGQRVKIVTVRRG